MIPESIKKKREKTFSECRRLISKINNETHAGSQPASVDTVFGESSEDDRRMYSTCGCCGESGIANEEIVQIESGQFLCPKCSRAFYTAS